MLLVVLRMLKVTATNNAYYPYPYINNSNTLGCLVVVVPSPFLISREAPESENGAHREPGHLQFEPVGLRL